MKGKWLLVLALVGGVMAAAAYSQEAPAAPCGDCCPEPPCWREPPQYPQRAVFYYPWWDGTTTPGGRCPDGSYADSRGYCRKWREMVNFWFHPDFDANGVFQPSVDLYNDRNAEVVQTQLARMAAGGIKSLISSFWTNERESLDKNGLVWQAVRTQNLVDMTLYWEGKTNRNKESVRTAMQTLVQMWRDDQTRFTVTADGRPVLFLYSPWYTGYNHDGCELMAWWNQALDWAETQIGVRPFLVADFSDDALATCPTYHGRSDWGWHHYDTGSGYYIERWAYGKRHTQTLSPGFTRHCWPQREFGPRECQFPEREEEKARDLQKWIHTVANAAHWRRLPPYFQLVATWNEWMEFTAVEPAVEWHSSSGLGLYLDALSWYPIP